MDRDRDQTVTKERLVLTGTIAPAQVPFLSLRDPGERLRQYLSAILLWARSGAVRSICFVESSNFQTEWAPLVAACAERGVELEIVSFAGSKDKVEAFGKGYGEAECLEHAIGESRQLHDDEPFWKITGRLFMANHAEVFAKHAGATDVFFKNRGTVGERIIHALRRTVRIASPNPRFTFTAMFKTTPATWRRLMAGVGEAVNERKRFYFEHAVGGRLRDGGIGSAGWWRDELRVVGLGASWGTPYNTDLRYSDVDSAIDRDVEDLVVKMRPLG